MIAHIWVIPLQALYYMQIRLSEPKILQGKVPKTTIWFHDFTILSICLIIWQFWVLYLSSFSNIWGYAIKWVRHIIKIIKEKVRKLTMWFQYFVILSVCFIFLKIWVLCLSSFWQLSVYKANTIGLI